MNNEIKVCLTIELEGSTIVRSGSYNIPYVITKQDINPLKKFKGNQGKEIVKKGSIPHKKVTITPAYQHINITTDSYNYMVSKECPYWEKIKDWMRMSKKARLESHLLKTCEHFRGKSFTYEVLED